MPYFLNFLNSWWCSKLLNFLQEQLFLHKNCKRFFLLCPNARFFNFFN